MKITELENEDSGVEKSQIVAVKTKRVLVGAGARILFYPTLFYNVCRNKVQPEFRWWDRVDEFILLGAVPFPNDVPRLQKLGVRGVITLNEPYETLVPNSLYKEYGIDQLVIPTTDYCFAPSIVHICQAVDFIHQNATCNRTTYVHCKAGRGRSTTIVLCYLVEYKNMTPDAALKYVRSKRPRVLLAPVQWEAVVKFSERKLEYPAIRSPSKISCPASDVVLVTEDDLDGYYSLYDQCEELVMSSRRLSQSMPAMLSPLSSITEDEVLITDDDLEGYNSDEEKSSYSIVRSKPMMSKLSVLFTSLKLASNCTSISSQLSEIHAC